MLTYRHTRLGCYVSYIVQAIVNNLQPLLFLTYQQEFSVSLTQISLLITLNFAIQMGVDLLSAYFIDFLGYRVSMAAAQVLSAAGLVCLAVLPGLMAPYAGLLIATVLCAVGGGLLEVLVSPLIEALPGDRKEQEMSLLHSFYCWGHVGVVLLTTGYFLLFGTASWRLLPLLWAVVPFLNTFLFLKTPLCSPDEQGRTMGPRQLFRLPLFWLMFLLMICSGASEQAMSQWASFFAEKGLQVSKTAGNLLGPCAFALLMGLNRLIFSKRSVRIERAILRCSALCVLCYLVTIFSPWPLLSLLGCAVCGFSVGIMWPGVFSLSARKLPMGGTAMFALLALAGDIGCCAGPSAVGAVSDRLIQSGAVWQAFSASSQSEAALKGGFLAALAFPLMLAVCMALINKNKKSGASAPPNP